MPAVTPQPIDDPIEVARFTRWESGGDAADAAHPDHPDRRADIPGGRVGVSTLQLSGMHCAACAGLIEAALMTVPGVLEAQVNAASRRARVRWDPRQTRPSAWIDAVRAAGYGAAPDAAGPALEMRRQEQRRVLWRLFVAGFCSMQVMMMATPSYVAAPGELSPDLRQLLNWGSWVLSLPVVWFAATPFFAAAWEGLRRRRIGMDVPVALGIVVTFVASTGATFDPAGPFGTEVYFDSLTMFVAFLWLGRFLDMRARHAAAQALEDTVSGAPETAVRVLPDGRLETVSSQRLAPGDIVRVPSGSTLPADGTLLGGPAAVGEALLTGESLAVAKGQGADLLAGSVNLGVPLEMRVTRAGPDTRQAAIVNLMREALSSRPATARLADRWAGPFLWAVLVLAAGSAAAWSWIDPGKALWVAVSVLIVTCPCALSLATPATLVAAAGGLARRGVLVRRLEALETMERVRQVFFDKTGTLTEDRLRLEAVRVMPTTAALWGGKSGRGGQDGPVEGPEEAKVLAWAASLAGWSSHPLSAALSAASSEACARTAPGSPAAGAAAATPAWQGVQEVAGEGLEALDGQGRRWRLGSARWVGAAVSAPAQGTAEMPGRSPAGSPADAPAESADGGGHRAEVHLACDGARVATFLFSEVLRERAAEAVAQLQARGMATAVLSGDEATRVEMLAARLGIAEVHGGASPERKLQVVREAQRGGAPVAMVGDGLNDAPVLAAADVSLAVGQGALAARQGADVVVLSGRMAGVVDLAATACRTMAIVRQNLVWSAVYNAACIPLAVTGWLPPWAAGLGMAGSSLLVVLNAQRAGRAAD